MQSQTEKSLICSSNPETWPKTGKILFLGEWCKLYSTKNMWAQMNYSVAKPYGISAEERIFDEKVARSLYLKILSDVRVGLNQLHNMNESEIYWEIIVGHWLERCIKIILNRFETFHQTIYEYRPEFIHLILNRDYRLATKNSQEWFWAINDDTWNNILLARFLPYLVLHDSSPVFTHTDLKRYSSGLEPDSEITKRPSWRTYLRNSILKISKIFQKDSDGLVISTYLPRNAEILLQILLGQFPQVSNFSNIRSNEAKYDDNSRDKLRKILNVTEGSGLEAIVRRILPDLLPTCYLEDFLMTKEMGNEMKWPSKPQFIFTSNNYDSDEVFKIWAAEKVASGCKYLIGQHGNVYGTHKFIANPSLEERIASKFITWGWGEGEPNKVRAFNFRVIGKGSPRNLMKSQGILLVAAGHDRGISTWDDTSGIEDYYNDQFALVSSLKPILRKELRVKLYYDHLFPLASQHSRWNDFDPTIQLENSRSFRELASASRLVIFSYDSTGLLEMLSLNKPVMAFWQNGIEHVRELAKPFYEELIAAGIIHTNPDTLSMLINSEYENLSTWWLSDKVQQARIAFCNSFSRSESFPTLKLRNIIKSELLSAGKV